MNPLGCVRASSWRGSFFLSILILVGPGSRPACVRGPPPQPRVALAYSTARPASLRYLRGAGLPGLGGFGLANIGVMRLGRGSLLGPFQSRRRDLARPATLALGGSSETSGFRAPASRAASCSPRISLYGDAAFTVRCRSPGSMIVVLISPGRRLRGILIPFEFVAFRLIDTRDRKGRPSEAGALTAPASGCYAGLCCMCC